MATAPFSFSDAALSAFSGMEDHLDGHYPTDPDDMNAPISTRPNNNMDSIFFQDLPGAPDSVFNSYGEVDWSMYQYDNPFNPSPAPAWDHDTVSSVGTVDEPFPPIFDTAAVGPPTLLSDFTLPSSYDFDDIHNLNDFRPSLDPSLSAASPASGLSSPDPSSLYDPFFNYGHPSQFLGAATDASSPPRQPAEDVGVDVSAGEVPFTFTYPQMLVIADQEDPPAAPRAAPTASITPRRTTRSSVKQKSVSPVDGGNEDSDSDDKPVTRGKPEYRCKYCPSVFDRSYNRNVHVAAVHERKKDYVCQHAKCSQAFARKHDLVRHVQSFHTDLGSPRRNPPANGEQKAGKQKN